MPRPLCPYCLKSHNFHQSSLCPETQWAIPTQYLRQYNQVPPLWLVSVGFTGHGKTVYLSALSLMIENIAVAWRQANHRYLNDYTRDAITKLRVNARTGELPEPTVLARLQPLLITMKGLPDFGDRCAVIYDAAGEVFTRVDHLTTTLPAIRQVRTIWFLISLKDLTDQYSRTMVDLFDVYTDAMQEMKVDLRGRNLIVVLTKADETADLPRPIMEYLVNDPLRDLTNSKVKLPDLSNFDMDDYLQKMEQISIKLQEYIFNQVRGGAGFINSARSQGMNIHFTITSALGHSPDSPNRDGSPKRLLENARRYRVLDPLVWALHLQDLQDGGSESAPSLHEAELVLALDSSTTGSPIYEAKLPELLADQLYDVNLSSYYLGFTRRTNNPGQTPPDRKARLNLPRLIGPLLDYLDMRNSRAKVVVVTAERLLDLKDYERSEWTSRLLLVNVSGDVDLGWSNTFTHRIADDPATLINTISDFVLEGR